MGTLVESSLHLSAAEMTFISNTQHMAYTVLESISPGKKDNGHLCVAHHQGFVYLLCDVSPSNGGQSVTIKLNTRRACIFSPII